MEGMGRFIVRRLIGMVAVLFAISVLIFLIFNVIPNGDPAAADRRQEPDQQLIDRINKDWGFNEPIYAAVRDADEEDLHRRPGLLPASRSTSSTRSRRDLPVTFSLASAPGSSGSASGSSSADLARSGRAKFTDTSLTVLALIGISIPVFLLGAMLLYYVAFKARDLPGR